MNSQQKCELSLFFPLPKPINNVSIHFDSCLAEYYANFTKMIKLVSDQGGHKRDGRPSKCFYFASTQGTCQQAFDGIPRGNYRFFQNIVIIIVVFGDFFRFFARSGTEGSIQARRLLCKWPRIAPTVRPRLSFFVSPSATPNE